MTGQSSVNRAIAAAIAAGVVGPSIAHADTTLTETINLTDLLTSGNPSYTGSFSIGSLLAAQGLSGAQITGATVTAYGMSDAVFNQTSTGYASSVLSSYAYSVQLSSGYSYSYGCGWNGTCYAYVPPTYGYALARTVLGVTSVTKTDTVQDSISLVAGSAIGAGAVSNQAPVTVVGPESYLGNTSNGTYGYDSNYAQTNTTTRGFYGALSAGAALGAADLYQLGSSGNLNFTVNDTLGSTDLTSVTLTFTAAPVPLPNPALLLTGGLAALAAAARRRRTHRELLV